MLFNTSTCNRAELKSPQRVFIEKDISKYVTQNHNLFDGRSGENYLFTI